jgi:nucleoside-diphosphate-sugar epimerase
VLFRSVEIIWKKIYPDKPLQIKNDPGFEYDVNKRVPSVVKAREVLEFEAKTTLSEMLDEVIPWIQSAIRENYI